MANENLNAALTKQVAFNDGLVAKLTALALKAKGAVQSADLFAANNKIKAELLPFALSDLLVMKGPANLATTPDTIQTGVGTEGWIYVMEADANGLSIDGITEVKVGDWLWFIDGKWHRLPFSLGGAAVDLGPLTTRVADLEAAFVTLGNNFETATTAIEAIEV